MGYYWNLYQKRKYYWKWCKIYSGKFLEEKGTVQYIIPEGKKTPIVHETQLKVDFFSYFIKYCKKKEYWYLFNMYLGKCIFIFEWNVKNELIREVLQFKKMKDFVLAAIKFIDKTEDEII